MKTPKPFRIALLLGLVTVTTPAAAHFKLMKPPSWLKEDQSAIGGGGPQKGSPCGPGGIDDVQPIPTSGIVTEFHAGDPVEIDWVDTVAHPGHYRIALAENRADLKNPTIVQDNSCNYDESQVPKTASGNVLADGVLFRSRVGFNDAAGKMFTYTVTLPSTPCDKCTLQVMNVMENDIKALSNCYYFHCADIRILPAGQPGSAGGASGTGGSAGSTGAGGMTIEAGGTFGFGGTLNMTGTGGMLLGTGGLLGTSGAPTFPGNPGTGGGSMGIAGVPAMNGVAGAVGTPGSGGGIANYGTSGTAGLAATPSSSENSGASCALTTHPRGGRVPAVSLALVTLLVRARRRVRPRPRVGRGE